MLREIPNTSQVLDKPERRWFSSVKMDVFIWVENGTVVGFQITYDKPHAEKALAWNADRGFTHHSVDDGSHSGRHPGSPLLVADGVLNLPRLVYLITNGFGDIAPDIKDFIVTKLINDYSREPIQG